MKALQLSLVALIFSSAAVSYAQIYDDYVGAGHNQGITVTTSSDHLRFGWDENATGEKTLDGSGLDAQKMEASRFLSQAALGGDLDDINHVIELGFEGWLDEQFDLASPTYVDRVAEILDQQLAIFIENGGVADEFEGPFWAHFQNTWWQTNLTNEDYLRQRMALALSEFLVVSFNSNLEEHTLGVCDYYDLLLERCFGNYKDLLTDVTYHPTMGVYLSHFNNPKAIPEFNIHPDENYAREIMQLFSIGLYELNMDGTEVLVGGVPVPTYDNADIKEMAKVFTGLGPGEVLDIEGIDEADFGVSRYATDFTAPMAMYSDWHEPGTKTLPNGSVINAGQTGEQDIEEAINFLFNHNNTPPFVARRLIQHMIKSNPTPAYIQRVSEAFADNGEGVRGDMKAVIKAILLDEEARTCDWIEDPIQGKLRESMVVAAHFSRANSIIQDQGYYWNTSYEILQTTNEAPLTAPTVFNFFRPDFQPNGDIQDMGLYGPEFQIHNSRTSLGFLNLVDSWTNGYQVWYAWEDIDPNSIDLEEYMNWAREPEVLINELDVLFTHGLMSDETRENIRTTIEAIDDTSFGEFTMQYRAQLALYLVLISPDYMILK